MFGKQLGMDAAQRIIADVRAHDEPPAADALDASLEGLWTGRGNASTEAGEAAKIAWMAVGMRQISGERSTLTISPAGAVQILANLALLERWTPEHAAESIQAVMRAKLEYER